MVSVVENMGKILSSRKFLFTTISTTNSLTITPETPAKHGISGQFKEFDNNDKSSFYMPRQYLPFHHGRIRYETFS